MGPSPVLDPDPPAKPAPAMKANGAREPFPTTETDPASEGQLQSTPVEVVQQDLQHIVEAMPEVTSKEGGDVKLFLAEVMREEFQQLGKQLLSQLVGELAKFGHAMPLGVGGPFGHAAAEPPLLDGDTEEEAIKVKKDHLRASHAKLYKDGLVKKPPWANMKRATLAAAGKNQAEEAAAAHSSGARGSQAASSSAIAPFRFSIGTASAISTMFKMPSLKKVATDKSTSSAGSKHGRKDGNATLKKESDGSKKVKVKTTNSQHSSGGESNLSQPISLPIPNCADNDDEHLDANRTSVDTLNSDLDSDDEDDEPKAGDHRFRSQWSDVKATRVSNNWGNWMKDQVMNMRKSDSSVISEDRPVTIRFLLAILIENTKFDIMMAVFLILNAAYIGAQVDYQARSPSEDLPHEFRAIDICFAVIFTVELVLRIFVHRRNFYRMDGWGWNTFDTVLVVQQLTELIIVATVGPDGSSGANVTSATARLTRFLRVLRMLRVIRIIRIVRFVTELRRVVYLILASMLTFMWAAILLAMLIYVLAILLTQVVADSMRENPELQGSSLTDYFGSTGDSIFNLYKGITGGMNWGMFSTPLEKYVSPLLAIIVAMYVAFATFVILNLVTGVFVEGAMTMSKEDKRFDLCRRLHKVFQSTDSDASGFIILEEFEKACRSRKMIEVLEMVGIKSNRARDLFCALDVDGQGGLNIEDFTEGIIDFQHPIKAFHFFIFANQMRASLVDIMRATSELHDRMEILCGKKEKGGDIMDRPSSMAGWSATDSIRPSNISAMPR